MSDVSQPRRKPITDSPWFWVYLFTIGGLVALFLMGPKFHMRQTQIERQYQGRSRAMQNQIGVEPATDMSVAGETTITLFPLYVALALVFVVAWVALWWTRFRGKAAKNLRPHDEAPR